MTNKTPFKPWERRGTAIYTEDDGRPGSSVLVEEYHGRLSVSAVQYIVNAHNLSWEREEQ